MGRQQMYKRLGVHVPFDSQHRLVSSAVFSPLTLAFIRSTLAIYTFVSLIFILIWRGTHFNNDPKSNAGSFFSYFTDLSLIGICAYFFASAVQTVFYVTGGGKGYPLQRWPHFLQFLHVLLISTIMTFPFLVTIVYWVILADADTFKTTYSTWSNITSHALNSVFVLFEILFTRIGPTSWFHSIFLIIILAGYLGIAYITRATQGYYTYSFLDPKKPGNRLAAYVVGIPVGGCIIFVVMQALCLLREYIIIRSHTYSQPPYLPEPLDEWQAVESPDDLPMAL